MAEFCSIQSHNSIQFEKTLEERESSLYLNPKSPLKPDPAQAGAPFFIFRSQRQKYIKLFVKENKNIIICKNTSNFLFKTEGKQKQPWTWFGIK